VSGQLHTQTILLLGN